MHLISIEFPQYLWTRGIWKCISEKVKLIQELEKKSRDGILAGFIFTPTLKKIMANAFSGQLQVAISLAIQQYFMLQSTLLECVRY